MSIRVHSKSGRFIALLPEDGRGGFDVVVTTSGVAAFNAGWPCSVLSDDYPIRFSFGSNGDLEDIYGTKRDGPELLALSEDAQEFGEKARAKRRSWPASACVAMGF